MLEHSPLYKIIVLRYGAVVFWNALDLIVFSTTDQNAAKDVVRVVLATVAVYKLTFPHPPKFDWTRKEFDDLTFDRSLMSLLKLESNDAFGMKLTEALWSAQTTGKRTGLITHRVFEACNTQLPKRKYESYPMGFKKFIHWFLYDGWDRDLP